MQHHNHKLVQWNVKLTPASATGGTTVFQALLATDNDLCTQGPLPPANNASCLLL